MLQLIRKLAEAASQPPETVEKTDFLRMGTGLKAPVKDPCPPGPRGDFTPIVRVKGQKLKTRSTKGRFGRAIKSQNSLSRHEPRSYVQKRA